MLATACDYDIHLPTTPTAVVQTAPVSDVVEFRVVGDLPLVTVDVSNALDGLSRVTTVLPYTSTLSLGGRDGVFISLTARGTGSGFLHASIFINGIIFREASSAQLFNPLVSVSGTYRRAK